MEVHVACVVVVVVVVVYLMHDVYVDLLEEGSSLGPSSVVGHRYVLEGRSAVPVTTFDEIANLIRKGNKQKRRAATAMNDRSSRAHSKSIYSVCCS